MSLLRRLTQIFVPLRPPDCRPPQEASNTLFHAAVPLVPHCPPQNEGVLISRWLRSRCAQSWRVWGSEKSLWGDYSAWCEQHKQLACRRELFCEIMSEVFMRDGDGWQGVALAIDFREAKYVM